MYTDLEELRKELQMQKEELDNLKEETGRTVSTII